ncbi:D-cysteine desulfhydrase [Neptunomonas japonica]|uniref:D-cysteine desulfhydrase n=1 Tax=Neptunomonas japonica JAMM 1380 TaxID=1441457 RepID=A0A7R6PL65_9GAMM|nr:D-cysteine desulfhydrase [Neptunomonas japonica]BBB31613.1 D-cysteine desulfhydrase [Neptunomonas japonica JAMM 1380]
MIDFDTFPRMVISHGPTPLEAMPRLSQALGCNLFIKRDDCTGLAGGGNKTRKLEYLLAAARDAGADTLITIGGLQSNHARQTAAAAAKFGFACELVLEDVEGTPKQDYYNNGNILLDKLFGATIHAVAEGVDSVAFADQLMARLIDAGKKPYLIPVGGSNEVGSLGYVRCANEILAQIVEQGITVDQIVLASGSAGTQAGLLAGLIAAGADIPVLGIAVSRDTQAQQALVQALLEKTLQHMGLDPALANGRVIADGGYYGAGYGITTPATIEAVKMSAEQEGVLLDPVYTGKGMAGLIDKCRTGAFSAKQNVLFLHTGGSQGLFAYREVLS